MVDSRQGYESSTVRTSDHKNSLLSGIEILNKIKQGITGTGTGTVHTSVRIQSKPIAYISILLKNSKGDLQTIHRKERLVQ